MTCTDRCLDGDPGCNLNEMDCCCQCELALNIYEMSILQCPNNNVVITSNMHKYAMNALYYSLIGCWGWVGYKIDIQGNSYVSPYEALGKLTVSIMMLATFWVKHIVYMYSVCIVAILWSFK